MKSRRRRKWPPLLIAAWGGFNAGAVLGLVDALFIMAFGLASFDKGGQFAGLIIVDAFGIGLAGAVVALIIFAAIPRISARLMPHRALISGMILCVLFLVSSLINLSWAFLPCEDPGPGKHINLLLMTIDTLRADAIGAGGNPIVRTPFLDRFAAGSLQCCNAVCAVPMTTPSHASIFTSAIPAIHGAMENRYRLGAENETLAELLREKGYRTAAFVSCFPLDHKFGLNQGFMLYDDFFGIPGDLRQASWLKLIMRWTTRNQLERKGNWTNSLAIPWLHKYAGAGPFFLWAHYFDPHAPYNPPDEEKLDYAGCCASPIPYQSEADRISAQRAAPGEELRPGLPEERYLGEVSFADSCASRLMQELAERKQAASTCVVIAADHGESMGEHGLFYTHGEDIYEPALSVPLMIRAPGEPAPLLTGRLASLDDIAPTVCRMMALAPGKSMQGFDVLDSSNHRSAALVENYGIIMAGNAVKQRGVRLADAKFISFGGGEDRALFELDSDPCEMRNLSSLKANLADSLNSATAEGFRKAAETGRLREADFSEDTLNKLKSMGYLQ
jgi:choline-sulfatase